MLEERLRTCDCEPGSTVFGIQRGTSLNHLHAKVRPLMKKQDATDFALHSLRHTTLTRFGETGVDSFTIKKTAGDSSVTTSEKYIHPSGDDGARISKAGSTEHGCSKAIPAEANTRCKIRFTQRYVARQAL